MCEGQVKNIMEYETVVLDDEGSALVILDQTKLPGSAELLRLHTGEEIWDAIYLLKVRGAPAIGVAAASICWQKESKRRTMIPSMRLFADIRNI